MKYSKIVIIFVIWKKPHVDAPAMCINFNKYFSYFIED